MGKTTKVDYGDIYRVVHDNPVLDFLYGELSLNFPITHKLFNISLKHLTISEHYCNRRFVLLNLKTTNCNYKND